MKFIKTWIIASTFLSLSAWAQVNINTATQSELEALDGIGEVKAKAIIDYRESKGKFNSVKDLVNVEGVGEKTIENLGGNIQTMGKTNLSALPDTLTKKAIDKTSAKTVNNTAEKMVKVKAAKEVKDAVPNISDGDAVDTAVKAKKKSKKASKGKDKVETAAESDAIEETTKAASKSAKKVKVTN